MAEGQTTAVDGGLSDASARPQKRFAVELACEMTLDDGRAACWRVIAEDVLAEWPSDALDAVLGGETWTPEHMIRELRIAHDRTMPGRYRVIERDERFGSRTVTEYDVEVRHVVSVQQVKERPAVVEE